MHESGGLVIVTRDQKAPPSKQYYFLTTIHLPESYSDLLIDWKVPNEYNSPYIEVDPPRAGNTIG
ncbi:hypothetical protein IT409_01965 [Candidatus Falkowbacteria bacterium]|nr:hypothetical protein [Candidatus Falkowbacteria bacterium]